MLLPQSRPTANPYVVLLSGARQAHPDVGLEDFTRRNALVGDYDVVHLHRPEIRLTGPPRVGAGRRSLYSQGC